MKSLVTIAERFLAGADQTAKPLSYYAVYQKYFTSLADQRLAILELGTYKGDSTRIFATFFGNSRILTVDLEPRDVDFSGFENVCSLQADQTDGPALERICGEFAPDGFDIVIDDASHVGCHSLRSYEILCPLVKPGGFYIVEDWGTGYWANWPDGAAIQPVELAARDGNLAKRIVSHDHGMVGFVKFLVDETAGRDRYPPGSASRDVPVVIEFLHVYPGLVILKKCP